ncbi:hypothetical protein PROFUN_12456 [Planoprotostelium fungivorum]|uniref:Uncharacterized protein n=1 Tax=Planoprotostelium fungivorum TaxID=1890364 RepID=A0A2P6N7B6_9EUKA|nr:hypothetical protein PROFUN_12456 [Planoprotostelium fungivorum]
MAVSSVWDPPMKGFTRSGTQCIRNFSNVQLVNKDWHTTSDLVFDYGIHNQYPIRRAAHFGLTQSVAALLTKSPVDPSVRWNWPLWTAASQGHIQVVKILLNDARVDATSGGEMSALQAAAQKKRTEVVEMICDHPTTKMTREERRQLVEMSCGRARWQKTPPRRRNSVKMEHPLKRSRTIHHLDPPPT